MLLQNTLWKLIKGKLMLKDRVGIIFGVANKRSIAWATAKALTGAGARLAFNYQGERLKENVETLAADIPGSLVLPCDVTKPDEVESFFEKIKSEFGRVDFLIHSIAFAMKEDMLGEFVNTSRDGFLTAMEISAYSLVSISRAAAPLMTNGGSVVCMTYYGAEKVVANYNVMGVAKAALEASTRYLAADLGKHKIRVNAISAGPINTLAARGVPNLSTMLKFHADRSPLKRNVEPSEVGNTALFLCSDLASAITGEVIHVDCGFSIMAL